ncbi:MAG TPA: shikimate kinase [Geobacter sp.]|nr:shikimate kinase [Geobacter sp.]
MIIVLIGYRGTGKTAVGDLLSQRLRIPCVRMDDEVVERAGMPINDIVARFGWPKFRDMESEVAVDMSQRDNIIVDTGGGVIERQENVDALKKNARIFWLKASVDTIVSRIQDGTARPALTTGKTFTEEVAEVLERRNPKYQAAAHHEIVTDERTPEQIADEIIALWTKAQR